MKHQGIILLALLLSAQISVNAQTGFDVGVAGSDLLEMNRTGMWVLGGWAATNIMAGSILSFQSNGSNKYFHLMNAGWNLVNLSIAGAALLSANPDLTSQLDFINHQHGLEKAYLFNAGLDVGYMMSGLFLMEKAKNSAKSADMLKGFGQSVLIQGAFLFIFDLVMYFLIK